MKRLFILTVLCLILCGTTALVPKEVQAADFGVGMTMLYTGWEPAFRDLYNVETVGIFLWGPAISLSFMDNWTVSVVALQNITNRENTEVTQEGAGISGPYTITSDSLVLRVDVDFILQYKIFDWFGIFTGYKYGIWGISTKDKASETVSTPYLVGDNKKFQSTTVNHGPALGMSFIFHLFENFSLMYSVSIIYLRSWSDTERIQYSAGNLLYYSRNISEYYNAVGCNNNLTFLYYIEAINLSLSLGGRFQVFQYFADTDAPSLETEYFYGLTASAVFVF